VRVVSIKTLRKGSNLLLELFFLRKGHNTAVFQKTRSGSKKRPFLRVFISPPCFEKKSSFFLFSRRRGRKGVQPEFVRGSGQKI